MTAPEPQPQGYTGAFIVCMPSGQFFGMFAADDGFARATETARDIAGFVVNAPMVADFRKATAS